ncbi:ABC transporter permease [Candidatus Woesearchaeota archaeon]|nr:ABC transporter permease [Candidatus Woesearchaeota archaeon]
MIYALWLREVKKYLRSTPRIIGSLGMPFFFLMVLGSGLHAERNYFDFIAPGILGMSLLFTSVFSGISLIWDKQFGFLREMLIAPVPRWKIMVGKTLGGATCAVLQSLLLLGITLVAGADISITGAVAAVPVMFLIAMACTAIGLIFGIRMNDMQAFPLIINFVNVPMFLLSGALYTQQDLPSWLFVLTRLNPLTYGVEAMRALMLGEAQLSLALCILVLLCFSMVMMVLGAYLFTHEKK